MRSFACRILPVVLVLGLSLPALGATPAEFYLSMLRKGISSYEAERYADAIDPLRIAAFGLVDSVHHYQTAHVYLALAFDQLKQAEDALDSARRIMAGERLEAAYGSLTLSPGTRERFDAMAKRILPPSDVAMLARSPQRKPAEPQPAPPQPQPAATNPTPPRAPAPKPVETKPAPIETKPAPVETKPAPVETKPAPVPVETKPAPVPVETKPASVPVETKPAPVPVETKPAPVPVETKPAPAPVETKPAPAETKPAPVETKPVETKPAPAPAREPEVVKPAPPKPAPIDAAARFAAAEQALSAARLPEARAIYRELLDSKSLERHELLRVAEGFYRARDFANALRAFEQLGALRRGEEPYRYYIAVSLYETGQYGAAKRELGAALPFIEQTADVARYRVKIEGALN